MAEALPADSLHEIRARRALGLNAAGCVAIGALGLVAARPLGRGLRSPAAIVALGGVGTAAFGVAVGVASVSEDWVVATRRVAVTDVVLSAGLVGLAAARGRPLGRVLALGVAAGLGAIAQHQVRLLVDHQGPVIA